MLKVELSQVELTQEELNFTLAAFNQLVKGGGLQLGDIAVLAPLVEKLNSKRKLPEQPKEESKQETPKSADLAAAGDESLKN